MNDKCGSKELMIELGENAGLKFKEMVPIKIVFCEWGKMEIFDERGKVNCFYLCSFNWRRRFSFWIVGKGLNIKVEN